MPSRDVERETSHLRKKPAVSVILTVVNEAQHLRDAVRAVLKSNYSGEIEVIIAVGPSRDRTKEVAQQIASEDSRVTVIENPSGRTPDGLNAALARSRHGIVVRIDGHCEIDQDYIDLAVSLLQHTGAVNVGGLMAAVGSTRFESAVARAMRSPIGVGSSRFHTGGQAGSVDTVYLGVFKKEALQEIGGYDQQFTRAQDWEMNYRLRSRGGVIWFDPRLKVTYRPRNSLRALSKQYFEYGRWRRAVSRRHKGTANWRYLAPPTNLTAQLLALILGLTLSPIFYLPIITYVVAILISSLVIGKSWAERTLLPAILITMHYSWGFGYLTSPQNLLTER